jgi:hypothetical protein
MKLKKHLPNALVVINILLFFTDHTLAKESSILVQKVEEVRGDVAFYNELNGTFLPVFQGMVIDKPILIQTGPGSEMIFSCVGKISARLSENGIARFSPGLDGRYEVELMKGTITASLDPDRPEGSPVFAVRTFAGLTEATGTLFAVTEYKGQSYTAVKNGTIKKKTTPPTKPDFSAYLKGAKVNPKKNISEKK